MALLAPRLFSPVQAGIVKHNGMFATGIKCGSRTARWPIRARLVALLAPYPAKRMTCWLGSPRVGNVKNNDPEPDRGDHSHGLAGPPNLLPPPDNSWVDLLVGF